MNKINYNNNNPEKIKCSSKLLLLDFFVFRHCHAKYDNKNDIKTKKKTILTDKKLIF